ncbi:MAG TPA: lysylphosphatidylglycerol synthase transmembrane domain-containing protein [Gemmatimonadales bacterium]|nr:lysylphosphatidylglycerol synthase transmembrane domain-containing protein [Gemmatimonadales bacterium]
MKPLGWPLRLALFGVGGTIFVVLVRRVGLGELVSNAASIGWVFLPVLAVYGLMLLCNAWAWHLSLAAEARRPPFGHLLALTTAGAALNYVTPMINAGGEPYRIAGLAPWIGPQRATASVILIRLLNTLALIITWVLALALALLLLPLAGAPRWVAVGALALSAGLGLVVLAGHRRGLLTPILDLVVALPLIGRATRRLERWRATLAEMDRQIIEFYHLSPRRFFQALGIEVVARTLFLSEYYLIGLGLGIAIDFPTAYLIGGIASLVQNVVFLIPYELGVKEGTLYYLFALAGMTGEQGLYTALVIRARDLAWVGLGLLVMGLVPHDRPAPTTAVS